MRFCVVNSFFSWAFFMLKKQVIHLDRMRLLLAGASWVSLTMLFEFGFMHFVAKIPWKKLFADYNLLQGRVWPLFLLTELASPLLLKAMKSFWWQPFPRLLLDNARGDL